MATTALVCFLSLCSVSAGLDLFASSSSSPVRKSNECADNALLRLKDSCYNLNKDTLEDYLDSLAAICEDCGIPVLETYAAEVDDPDCQSDILRAVASYKIGYTVSCFKVTDSPSAPTCFEAVFPIYENYQLTGAIDCEQAHTAGCCISSVATCLANDLTSEEEQSSRSFACQIAVQCPSVDLNAVCEDSVCGDYQGACDQYPEVQCTQRIIQAIGNECESDATAVFENSQKFARNFYTRNSGEDLFSEVCAEQCHQKFVEVVANEQEDCKAVWGYDCVWKHCECEVDEDCDNGLSCASFWVDGESQNFCAEKCKGENEDCTFGICIDGYCTVFADGSIPIDIDTDTDTDNTDTDEIDVKPPVDPRQRYFEGMQLNMLKWDDVKSLFAHSCESNNDGDFCIPMVTGFLAEIGHDRPMCSEVADLGCCAGTWSNCLPFLSAGLGAPELCGFSLQCQIENPDWILFSQSCGDTCEFICNNDDEYTCFQDFAGKFTECSLGDVEALIETANDDMTDAFCVMDCANELGDALVAMNSDSDKCLNRLIWSRNTIHCEDSSDCESDRYCSNGLCCDESGFCGIDEQHPPPSDFIALRDEMAAICHLSASMTLSPSLSPSISISSSLSASVSVSVSLSAPASVSVSLTASESLFSSPSMSPSITPSLSESASITPSISESASITPSKSNSGSITPSISKSASVTPSKSKSASVTPTKSKTASKSVTSSKSVTRSISLTTSITGTISVTRSVTPTRGRSKSPSPSPSPEYADGVIVTAVVTIPMSCDSPLVLSVQDSIRQSMATKFGIAPSNVLMTFECLRKKAESVAFNADIFVETAAAAADIQDVLEDTTQLATFVEELSTTVSEVLGEEITIEVENKGTTVVGGNSASAEIARASLFVFAAVLVHFL